MRHLRDGLWLPMLAALIIGIISMRYAFSESWALVAQHPSGTVETVSHLSYQLCQRIRGQVYLDTARSEEGAAIECVLR